ncbi:hypothetical protein [uncultured Paraglaciecola sp.]|jgi:hypothetical protein|uniref:hypothetical protein n=1 Tax=uncultured Paraglaciecola sp. TaxID=1765024 RepID=UPI0025D28950|nr:hypothetical protein [uncultured Paraglaciecola sp.]
MKSLFDPKHLEKQINSHLDKANEALSEDIQNDIHQARVMAIAQAKLKVNTLSDSTARRIVSNISLRHMFSKKVIYTTTPIALALLILVSYQPTKTIPALPMGLYSEDVPMEDLAMLEDLEFADWLAEQQEVLH